MTSTTCLTQQLSTCVENMQVHLKGHTLEKSLLPWIRTCLFTPLLPLTNTPLGVCVTSRAYALNHKFTCLTLQLRDLVVYNLFLRLHCTLATIPPCIDSHAFYYKSTLILQFRPLAFQSHTTSICVPFAQIFTLLHWWVKHSVLLCGKWLEC